MVTTRQPEWDAEDKAIIYALLDYKADQCPGCGHPLSESLEVPGRSKQRYEGSFFVCDGCEALEKKQREIDKSDQKLEENKQWVFRSARRWIVRIRKFSEGVWR